MSRNEEGKVLKRGNLPFSIESRILRELGERLVKAPEVALLELVKNSYDADATVCRIRLRQEQDIVVSDDGVGMTLLEFTDGWMRVGTSSKEGSSESRRYKRMITGEKGIGRLAVRFLGRKLELQSTAIEANGRKTKLRAVFDWPTFDKNEDIGEVSIPYELRLAGENDLLGTTLVISDLRQPVEKLNLDEVRNGALGVVTPYGAFVNTGRASTRKGKKKSSRSDDPGFSVEVEGLHEAVDGEISVASDVLSNFVLRGVANLVGDRLNVKVFRRGEAKPSVSISERYKANTGNISVDIRFFPRRKGTFTDLAVDGRRAESWVRTNSGVAVFDRAFRVYPYGSKGDDWLQTEADTARNERNPRSTIAKKHFPMDAPTKASTKLNYMLRLPQANQVVGVVQVKGARNGQRKSSAMGLVASADREGFVNNSAFYQLQDIVRGVVEALASEDRELQLEEIEAQRKSDLKELRVATRAAVREIESNPAISKPEKTRIVRQIAQAEVSAKKYEETSRERESALEVMSLMGVVAGFMTHEFGAALNDIEGASRRIKTMSRKHPELKSAVESIEAHVANLAEFVKYSQGYVQGAATRPEKPYPARPRLQQIVRVFGAFAEDRDITVSIDVERDVIAPLVPLSLYNGIGLNLFSNALKAVASKVSGSKKEIAFRAWNEDGVHTIEVSDTGVGIPAPFRERVFDALFTTTATNRDPLGSGMGLGLALVRRSVKSFGGSVDVVDPPPDFATCIRVKIPLVE